MRNVTGREQGLEDNQWEGNMPKDESKDKT